MAASSLPLRPCCVESIFLPLHLFGPIGYHRRDSVHFFTQALKGLHSPLGTPLQMLSAGWEDPTLVESRASSAPAVLPVAGEWHVHLLSPSGHLVEQRNHPAEPRHSRPSEEKGITTVSGSPISHLQVPDAVG